MLSKRSLSEPMCRAGGGGAGRGAHPSADCASGPAVFSWSRFFFPELGIFFPDPVFFPELGFYFPWSRFFPGARGCRDPCARGRCTRPEGGCPHGGAEPRAPLPHVGSGAKLLIAGVHRSPPLPQPLRTTHKHRAALLCHREKGTHNGKGEKEKKSW